MSLLETILESTDWITTVVLAAVAILAISAYVRWSQMPPGPVGLPYLGYYPFLSETGYQELSKLTTKYGKVFCFRVTGQLYVHISDMKSLREANVTKSDCFEKRPTNFTLFRDIFGEGVFQTNGEEWKVTRKFFLKQFKDLGMGKKAQEGAIHDALLEIVSFLNKRGGKNFNGLQSLTDAANDVIFHLIFGGVKLDDNDITDFHRAYRISTDFTNGMKILLAGPLLKYFLIPYGSEYSSYRKYKKEAYSIIAKIIQQHEREFDRNNIRNLVDTYINERKFLEQNKDPKSKYFSERALVSSVLQIFGDGALGVGWLVSFILNAIASRPDIQKTIQAEVDEVVGRNRLPGFDDRSRLSFTSAVVYEGQRTSDFFPILPSLECTKETTVGGCRVPKGTVTAYNMWAIFHDPDVYHEPYKFDPTRFLSVDGKKPRCEIPAFFGVGKRSCIGESLATMQMILYVATVLQNFDIHTAEGFTGKKDDEEWKIMLRATPRQGRP